MSRRDAESQGNVWEFCNAQGVVTVDVVASDGNRLKNWRLREHIVRTMSKGKISLIVRAQDYYLVCCQRGMY